MDGVALGAGVAASTWLRRSSSCERTSSRRAPWSSSMSRSRATRARAPVRVRDTLPPAASRGSSSFQSIVASCGSPPAAGSSPTSPLPPAPPPYRARPDPCPPRARSRRCHRRRPRPPPPPPRSTGCPGAAAPPRRTRSGAAPARSAPARPRRARRSARRAQRRSGARPQGARRASAASRSGAARRPPPRSAPAACGGVVEGCVVEVDVGLVLPRRAHHARALERPKVCSEKTAALPDGPSSRAPSSPSYASARSRAPAAAPRRGRAVAAWPRPPPGLLACGSRARTPDGSAVRHSQ
eukprot:1144906-Prymnesium_polylepis.1